MPGGNEDAVYVMGEDGLAQITVNVGLSDGQWTEVTSPELNLGDKVAVDILEKN